MTQQPSGTGGHALEVGATLGPYRILGKLGEGGMGEVYRAEDPRLGRIVAIKTIPQLFATDADRTARFEREARALATLNHPNIAQIYGIERAADTHAIVMELVEGEDLARRLTRGPVLLEDAVQIARQVADALEAAHEQSIVHRDLKPANIKLRPDGTVKVLDFGLAKMASDGAGADRPVHDSPTFTSPVRLRRGSADVTAVGVILGTAAYMAPEQARGRAVDRRADIWAFGCVLFEMLTGRPPFGGDDISSLLAAILKDDVDWTMLPEGTPPSIRRLLRRCLEMDPRRRLSAVADARLELDDARVEPLAPPMGPAATPWNRRIVWAASGAAVGVMILLPLSTSRAPAVVPAPVVRSEVPLEAPLRLSGLRAFAISPDASEIVYMAAVDGDKWALFRRSLRTGAAALMTGTEWGEGPFFSPDGAWLVFGQQGRLKKVPSAGGSAIDLGEALGWQGGSFAPDGSLILNLRHGQGLVRISADDGNRAVLTTVDHAAGEAGHHWPHVLPDGRHVLYTLEVDGKPYSEARIVLLSLVTGQRRVLIDGGTDARYLPTGHVVYWREGAVWKVPFDTDRLELTGQASLALPNVMVSEANGHAHFAATADGTLVYLSGRDAQMERSVMLVDRTGQSRALTADRPILRVGIDLARWTPARSGDHRRERQPLDDGTGSNVIDANHV